MRPDHATHIGQSCRRTSIRRIIALNMMNPPLRPVAARIANATQADCLVGTTLANCRSGCGLDVPACRLAEDGAALVVDRFDLRENGTYLGVEDFCVLNARPTEEKYNGSYETAVAKRLADYVEGHRLREESAKLFTLIALNVALRNGDAHLKNFAIVYDEVEHGARLSPVYDIVTTTAYIPGDRMALTLDGSTRWPDARRLRRLGETRLLMTPAECREVFQRIKEAVSWTRRRIVTYRKSHPAFDDIGARMMAQWDSGLRESLADG